MESERLGTWTSRESSVKCHQLIISFTEMIQQDMMQQAKAKLAQDPSIISDPALIAALSNKVSEAPRLVAIQRVFSGPFKLDMFYDAADAQSLSSKLQSPPPPPSVHWLLASAQ